MEKQIEEKQIEEKQVEKNHMDNNQIDNKQVEKIQTTTVKSTTEKFIRSRKIVYYILGALEFLLGFRFIFKLLGANPEGTFVSLIYTITGVLLAPFNSIFRAAVNDGIETKSVFEPANLIAMAVYALIAYGIIKLIKIYAIPKSDEKDNPTKL